MSKAGVNQQPITCLSPEMAEYLNGECLVILSTVEKETNSPNISTISWVKSLDEKKVRFAVMNNSRMIDNIRSNAKIVMCIIGLGSVYSIVGTCSIMEDTMEGVPLKLSKVELTIDAIYNSMFWGAEIVQAPKFEKTYNLEKVKTLDSQVYDALMRI
jgi:hypothetical protein